MGIDGLNFTDTSHCEEPLWTLYTWYALASTWNLKWRQSMEFERQNVRDQKTNYLCPESMCKIVWQMYYKNLLSRAVLNQRSNDACHYRSWWPRSFDTLNAFTWWNLKYPYIYHLDIKCIMDYSRFKPYNPVTICRQNTLVCKLMLTSFAGANIYNNVGKWFGLPQLNGYPALGRKLSC